MKHTFTVNMGSMGKLVCMLPVVAVVVVLAIKVASVLPS